MLLLHVDDDDAVRRAVARMLASRPIEVLPAARVADAERLLEEREVDAALIDVWLPDGSGFELYAWIQQHRRALAKRVAFATGDIVHDASNKDLGALGRPVLPKPFNMADLLRLVDDWAGA
jgi:DNA-binding NtrC family response regulator